MDVLRKYENSTNMNWNEISKYENQMYNIFQNINCNDDVVVNKNNNKITQEVVHLLKNMLCYDPNRRLSANDLFNHDFFRSEPLPTPLHLMPRIDGP
jgi:serine/threonine protein kinase